jgi:hypothetical protein
MTWAKPICPGRVNVTPPLVQRFLQVRAKLGVTSAKIVTPPCYERYQYFCLRKAKSNGLKPKPKALLSAFIWEDCTGAFLTKPRDNGEDDQD